MKIKWAMIGSGYICERFADAIGLLENSEIAALHDVNVEMGRRFAERYHIPKFYENYADIVNDPEIQIVYIGSPNLFHKDNVLGCLEHGKHVLCEKPMSICAENVQLMVDTARRNNVFLMEAVFPRFFPTFEKMKQWIADGRIGKVGIMHAQFNNMQTGWRLNPEMAGGALFDCGVYVIQLFSAVMNGMAPTKISSTFKFVDQKVDVRDCITLEYGDVMAVATFSMGVCRARNAAIYGDKGTILIDDILQPTQITLNTVDGNTEIIRCEVEGETHFPKGYQFEARAVEQCLLEGKTECSVVPLDDTLLMANIVDQLRRQSGYPFSEEFCRKFVHKAD